jgi:hypothetical protein
MPLHGQAIVKAVDESAERGSEQERQFKSEPFGSHRLTSSSIARRKTTWCTIFGNLVDETRERG